MLPDAVSGQISIWSGSVVSIPTGWVLCDGNNGTPDLRDKFVVGAGSSYAVGGTGGLLTHTHRFRGDGHAHSVSITPGLASGAIPYGTSTSSEEISGETDATNHLSPYYSLAYIMYL